LRLIGKKHWHQHHKQACKADSQRVLTRKPGDKTGEPMQTEIPAVLNSNSAVVMPQETQ
jgi:hypothetical protein